MKMRMLLCGLLAAANAEAEPVGRSEQTYYLALTILASPYLSGTSVLVTVSKLLEGLTQGDLRVLADAREGALQAVANDDLDDVRLQAALALLRSRFALDGVSDLQLAQWIAVNG